MTRPSRTRPPGAAGRVVAAMALLAAAAVPGAGQDVRDARLENGLRVSSVRLPGASSRGAVLVLPGRTPEELPPGTVALLTRGLEEAAGPGLRAVADADGLLLESADSLAGLDDLLAPLARAVEVPVPAAAVAALRRTRVDSLSARLQTASGAATRILLEELYGGHPYGRTETPRSLRSVGVGEVEGARRALLRPEGATLVVTGPDPHERVLARARAALGRWTAAGPAPAPGRPARPPGGSGRTLLVHMPGSHDAVLHAGGLLPTGGHADWPALSVLDAWLGTPAGPLFRVTGPDGAGLVVGAAVSADRRAGPGLFHLRASLRPSLLADALRGLRLGLEASRARFPAPDEVRAVAGALADGLEARRGSPPGLARLLAAHRLLGLPDDRLRGVPDALRSLGPQDVREAALDHVDPDRMAWVVAGDAGLLAPALAALGPVDVVDAAGRPLAEAAWAPRWRLPEAGDLPPTALRASYRVTLAGREIGSAEKRLSAPAADGSRTFRTAAFVAGRTLRQEVTVDAELRPVELASSSETPRGRGSSRLRREGDRLRGTVDQAGETRTVSGPLPPGAVAGDALELLLWAMPLEAGSRYTVPVALPEEARVAPARIEVVGPETVATAAGEFEAWRVDVVGVEAQTFWLRARAPHVPVRVEPAGQPLRFDLISLEEDDGG